MTDRALTQRLIDIGSQVLAEIAKNEGPALQAQSADVPIDSTATLA